mmetsp:Transcript_65368/g.168921  ORF Transcript_65368/g.168921 Transcript_65368/m.168921 type:complete len:202 (-) Transcript_65368:94-699(-)|eukprot:CAMPEP_0183419840 /NCGR_PEP_ID=MMETSP0370-20130417/26051_1 /TAXON_ID=268820 /ORGANISM="Peridinium aciculiferum, Strain PAER-2" /LENGTH=201 /DNA_ID=CAMNT_0025603675 /DNA_START=459 /DNA_END=1064 /DNA_ORIENTATION=-
MPPPMAPTRFACALQSARIAVQSSCVYAAGTMGFTDQPRLRCAPGQWLATADKKSSAGMAAGEARKPGPGKTSAFNHTACPLSARRERTAAKIGKLSKAASKLLKSNFRCRLPSFMQASKNISKERSELRIGGCAMITWVQLWPPSEMKVPTCTSASIAVTVSLANASRSFEPLQHEWAQTWSGAGNGAHLDGLTSLASAT